MSERPNKHVCVNSYIYILRLQEHKYFSLITLTNGIEIEKNEKILLINYT